MEIIDRLLKAVSEYEIYLRTNLPLLICIAATICLVSVFLRKKDNIKLLIMYMIVVFYLTFLNRNFGSRKVRFTPFWSYRLFLSDNYLRNEILCNIIFFIPLGTILYLIRPQRDIIPVLIIISMSIELLQFITARGLMETDDVISNVIGGLLGIMLARLCVYVRKISSEK